MHIPDGYLGPQTYGTSFAIMAPIWGIASKKLRKTLGTRQIPTVALGAAFSFVVMFLNVPVLGRLSAHPVGAGLVAIVIGPWAACLAISAALAIQAVPFGDGGITTYAANCLNMAVIAPFVTWGVFRLIAGANPGQRRLWIGSAAAGFLGVVASAAAVAIEVGLQPIISPHGGYLPYSIKAALTAMVGSHILIVGPVEAIITASCVGYLFRTERWRLPTERAGASIPRRLLVVSGVIAILAPLGVIIPSLFGSGPAWGEWGKEELARMLGYVPGGIARGADLWRAPLSDYALPGKEAGPVSIMVFVIAGALCVIALVFGIGWLAGRKRNDAAS